ncbi:hypothetical protein C1646_750245 [Rhizophagus diaphanus]|nr:hypothetical protein C1646_750245 [Rhizophagus diaphanus] [Rhizophagus sp. MUCL 43196]
MNEYESCRENFKKGEIWLPELIWQICSTYFGTRHASALNTEVLKYPTKEVRVLFSRDLISPEISEDAD